MATIYSHRDGHSCLQMSIVAHCTPSHLDLGTFKRWDHMKGTVKRSVRTCTYPFLSPSSMFSNWSCKKFRFYLGHFQRGRRRRLRRLVSIGPRLRLRPSCWHCGIDGILYRRSTGGNEAWEKSALTPFPSTGSQNHAVYTRAPAAARPTRADIRDCRDWLRTRPNGTRAGLLKRQGPAGLRCRASMSSFSPASAQTDGCKNSRTSPIRPSTWQEYIVS